MTTQGSQRETPKPADKHEPNLVQKKAEQKKKGEAQMGKMGEGQRSEQKPE
jgi:hypothetical protein